jgi:hypothetical protein
MKVSHLIINFFRWYVDGLRQPTLNAVARMILVWSLTALAAISASVTFDTVWLSVSLASGNGSTYFFMFLALCAIGMLVYSEFRDRKIASDSQLIKIRHMGLIDHSIDDVENYFPTCLKKIKPQALNIEFSNSHKTSDEEELKMQLAKISRITDTIMESGSSLNNAKKHIVYSGVAPVPMIAAAGHVISNMQNVNVADWNRQKKKWHFSTDLDDGEKISINLDTTTSSQSSVNLLVSFSLPIDRTRVQSDFPSLSCCQVTWENKDTSYDKLGSSEKQERIVSEILGFINNKIIPANTDLENLNVFIAAQASFVFRLGAALNQGHLPKIIFYHYNPDHPKKYHPWGVSLKSGNVSLLVHSLAETGVNQ